MTDADPQRFCLRMLPLPTRLVLALFLIAMSIGYFAGLVQLHFAHAKVGEVLPSAQDAVDIYHGRAISKVEKLLTTTGGQFSGNGTMRPAFFELYESGSSGKLEDKRKEWDAEKKQHPELEKERLGELQALLDWVRTGANRKAFEDDKYILPKELADKPITSSYLVTDNNKPVQPPSVTIQTIFRDRCVRCHTAGGNSADNKAKKFPMDEYDQIANYTRAEFGTGMSLNSLALTTHVHLLGFGMMFALTGVIFSLTSYPVPVRVVIAPLALLAQVVDIGCWWAGRTDPMFAQAIVYTGGIVAASLLVQILGSLFNMFGKGGKAVVFLLLLAAVAAAYGVADRYVIPFLDAEKAKAAGKP
jgi:hypothetical protein